MGYTVNGILSLYKVYRGWGLQRSDPTDPPKENGLEFAPTVPMAYKFRLVLLSIRYLSSRRICTENESKVANCLQTFLSETKPSTEPWFELRVTVER